jgi:hypothetical protein
VDNRPIEAEIWDERYSFASFAWHGGQIVADLS